MSIAREFGLTRAQALAVLGAARAVVEAAGPAHERGASLLATLGKALDVEGDWRAVPASENFAPLRELFPDPAARRALADAMVIPACVEGEVSPEGERAARSIAAGLRVRSHWVELLGALRRRRVLSVKRALGPRSPDARRIFQRVWAEEGVLGLWRALQFVLGVFRDPELAARFRALGSSPEGTLGRAVADHFAATGFAFPGERGGVPERMFHHDLMHIVNGYGTDAAGECELAGFYAGFAPGDSFTFIVIVLATFQLGLAVSPAAVTPARGAFDPERVLASYLRGRRLKVDVMGPWDYWALMPLPIDEVRRRLGIGAAPSRGSPAVVEPTSPRLGAPLALSGEGLDR